MTLPSRTLPRIIMGLTVLFGLAAFIGILLLGKEMVSMFYENQKYPDRSYSGFMLTGLMGVLILMVYVASALQAISKSKTLWYRVFAVLTFIAAAAMMLPSFAIGLHYQPGSWPIFVAAGAALLAFCAFLFWGAGSFKHAPDPSTMRVTR